MDLATVEPIIAWQSHEGQRIARIKGYDIIACDICGFRHALPLPDAAALERAYREHHCADENPGLTAHPGEDQRWAELARRDRLEILERHLGPSRRRLLDIGSGPGLFLQTAKNQGWQVLGIEPSRHACAHARSLGVEVVEGHFSEATADGLGRFDVVLLNNVLEHVPDPMWVVNTVRDLLDRDGLICISVSNDFSPLQLAGRAAAGTDEWWLAPPLHLNYFDFDSAAAMLQRLGFTVVERTTSFPMELFLMMGEDYTNDAALGSACHAKRRRFDLALEAAGLKETRRAFYRALAQVGLGREAVLIAART